MKPKFEIGQKVICCRVSYSFKMVICPDCMGKKTWHVVAPSGEEWDVPCNTCSAGYYSTGQIKEYGDQIHKATLTIGSIRMDTHAEDVFSYMCCETGVGSGSIYYERELFPGDREADEYGAKELERVKGRRQEQELRKHELKKRESVYKPDPAPTNQA